LSTLHIAGSQGLHLAFYFVRRRWQRHQSLFPFCRFLWARNRDRFNGADTFLYWARHGNQGPWWYCKAEHSTILQRFSFNRMYHSRVIVPKLLGSCPRHQSVDPEMYTPIVPCCRTPINSRPPFPFLDPTDPGTWLLCLSQAC
jgi:hypothetical protein